MVIVIAHSYAKAERVQETIDLYAKLVEETRKEKGCVQYDLVQDNADSSHLTVLEQWESQEALDAHMKTPHFTDIVPKIGALRAKEGYTSICKKII